MALSILRRIINQCLILLYSSWYSFGSVLYWLKCLALGYTGKKRGGGGRRRGRPPGRRGGGGGGGGGKGRGQKATKDTATPSSPSTVHLMSDESPDLSTEVQQDAKALVPPSTPPSAVPPSPPPSTSSSCLVSQQSALTPDDSKPVRRTPTRRAARGVKQYYTCTIMPLYNYTCTLKLFTMCKHRATYLKLLIFMPIFSCMSN